MDCKDSKSQLRRQRNWATALTLPLKDTLGDWIDHWSENISSSLISEVEIAPLKPTSHQNYSFSSLAQNTELSGKALKCMTLSYSWEVVLKEVPARFATKGISRGRPAFSSCWPVSENILWSSQHKEFCATGNQPSAWVTPSAFSHFPTHFNQFK